jgi:hypothetical protein
MKSAKKCALIITLGLAPAFDLRAAAVLCKAGFVCPIVANMSTNGSGSAYDNTAGAWGATGPWGNGGAAIRVYVGSACSTATSGTPAADGGLNCWCRMRNGSAFGVWNYRNKGDSVDNCNKYCEGNCAYSIETAAGYRSALCVPPADQNNICDGTTVIAEGACPAGYILCAGSKNASNDFGSYTVTCSE